MLHNSNVKVQIRKTAATATTDRARIIQTYKGAIWLHYCTSLELPSRDEGKYFLFGQTTGNTKSPTVRGPVTHHQISLVPFKMADNVPGCGYLEHTHHNTHLSLYFTS